METISINVNNRKALDETEAALWAGYRKGGWTLREIAVGLRNVRRWRQELQASIERN